MASATSTTRSGSKYLRMRYGSTAWPAESTKLASDMKTLPQNGLRKLRGTLVVARILVCKIGECQHLFAAFRHENLPPCAAWKGRMPRLGRGTVRAPCSPCR